MNGETRFARLQYIQHQQNFVDLIASLADFSNVDLGGFWQRDQSGPCFGAPVPGAL